VIRILAAATICWALSGCNAVGFIASVAGNPDVPAEYVPAKKPTIVVVKDLPDPNGGSNESEELAAEVDEQLNEHGIVPVVSSAKVAALRSEQTGDQTLSPAEIGRAASANQVIYIQLDKSSLDAGPVNDVLKGQIGGNVSVIDAATGQTLWPTDGSDGAPVSYETPMMHTGDDVTRSTVRANLCAGLADQVAKLFYKYKSEQK
jgi:hypothetical protein